MVKKKIPYKGKVIKRQLYEISQTCVINHDEIHKDEDTHEIVHMNFNINPAQNEKCYYANAYLPYGIKKDNKDIDITIMKLSNNTYDIKLFDIKRQVKNSNVWLKLADQCQAAVGYVYNGIFDDFNATNTSIITGVITYNWDDKELDKIILTMHDEIIEKEEVFKKNPNSLAFKKMQLDLLKKYNEYELLEGLRRNIFIYHTGSEKIEFSFEIQNLNKTNENLYEIEMHI